MFLMLCLQVMDQLALWADKSGAVGCYFGDELYGKLLGVSVCRSDTLVGCLAQFWQAVVNVIHEHADEYHPTGRWDIGKSKRSQLHLVAFPDCPQLYDYKSLKMLNAAVEFSKEQCLFLGKRFTLTAFHPKYKNSPKSSSPARNSPFPCSGLHFAGLDEEYIDHLMEQNDGLPRAYNADYNVRYFRDMQDEDDDDDDYKDVVIPDLEEEKLHLEILYNSAAASSQEDSLDRDPLTRRNSQRCPRAAVVESSQEWIKKTRYVPRSRGKINRALQFADTVEDRWIVSETKVAEEVYADIWKAISDLHDLGVVADARESAEEVNTNTRLGFPD